MTEAVEDHGLTVERYNVIARSLPADAELLRRVQQKRKEIEEES